MKWILLGIVLSLALRGAVTLYDLHIEALL